MPPREIPEKNKLYYGDNLAVLRDYIPDQSIDLIYLDPPFNSRQDYNVLFAEKDGARSYQSVIKQGILRDNPPARCYWRCTNLAPKETYPVFHVDSRLC